MSDFILSLKVGTNVNDSVKNGDGGSVIYKVDTVERSTDF